LWASNFRMVASRPVLSGRECLIWRRYVRGGSSQPRGDEYTLADLAVGDASRDVANDFKSIGVRLSQPRDGVFVPLGLGGFETARATRGPSGCGGTIPTGRSGPDPVLVRSMAWRWRPIYHRGVGPGTRVGAGRSTAIVLFTDLGGSTELRSRLGENAAEELRHKLDALAADAVQAHRGHQV